MFNFFSAGLSSSTLYLLLEYLIKHREKWTDLIRSGAILTPEMITETVGKLAR